MAIIKKAKRAAGKAIGKLSAKAGGRAATKRLAKTISRISPAGKARSTAVKKAAKVIGKRAKKK